jgi:hypothetical protein
MLRLAFYLPPKLVTIVTLTVLASVLGSANAAPIPDLPQQLYFKTVGEPSMRVTEYRLGQEGMLTRVIRLRGLSEDCTRKVTPLAWSRFQQRTVSLHLPKWKAEYATSRKVYDGLTWTLHYQTDAIDITSTGHEIGPDAADPSKGVDLDNPACSAIILLKALEDLFSDLDPLK